MDALVSTDWLERELGASDLRVVDATKFLGADRDARAEYEVGHIPGAVFMDLAELADANSAVDNMAPPAEKFASRMQSLGLGDGSRIVLYDDSPLKSAARGWWLLKLFGAHDVALLDGGLAKWKAEGRPLEMGKQTLRHRHFTVWRDAKAVRTKEQMLENLASDALSGEVKLPRATIETLIIGGKPMLVPVMAFDVTYHWDGEGDAFGQNAGSFVLGREQGASGSEKLAPLPLDRPNFVVNRPGARTTAIRRVQ